MAECFLQEGETLDDLGGGVRIIQNPALYRFTSDAVLLARFARAKRGDRVADLCAGGGAVGLQFYALHPADVRGLVFFEMQPALSEMSARSAALNGLACARAECCRVQDIGAPYTEAFSLALCNPPYGRGGFADADPHRALCRSEIALTLQEAAAAAARVLKFGGRLAMCHRADRLAEVLYTLKGAGIEPKRVQPVCGRAGAAPYLVLAEGVKGGKPGCELLPDLVNA